MKLFVVALAAAVLPATFARAQSDPMQMARVASANQVGLMEYCQSKGWADQTAVDLQKSSAATLPPASDATGLAAAEATGKTGSLLNNGKPMALSAMATQTNTSEQALCGKMADAAKMVQAQRSANPAMMSGMPTSMPAMPSGMSMPPMPKMPKPN